MARQPRDNKTRQPSPKTSLAREVARLRSLTVAELVPAFKDLHGAPPRSRNRDWLWRRCAWKLQERALGGLSEAAKRRLDELIDAIEIPTSRPTRTVAEGLRGDQDRGRPASRRSTTPAVTATRPTKLHHAHRDLPPPGTTIVRNWHGRDLRLTFHEDGVEVDGAFHSSLTAAARAITGSKWNGRLFWLGKNRDHE